jgi:hypothetical protein
MIMAGTAAGLAVRLTGIFGIRKGKLRTGLDMFRAAATTLPVLLNGFFERKNITSHEISNDGDMVDPLASDDGDVCRSDSVGNVLLWCP